MPKNPPASTTPTPPLPDELAADLPAFSQPRTMPSDDPLDPTTSTLSQPSTPSPSDEIDDLEDDDWAGLGDESASPSSTTTRPTGPSPASIADAKDFQPLVETAVQLGTLGLNARLAGPESTVWLMNTDELEGVSVPLSRILARHAPIKGGAAGDAADAIAAGVAVTGYVVRNIVEAREERGGQQQAEQNAGS